MFSVYIAFLYIVLYTALLAAHGECVVVLADPMLLELPLEALTVLQGSGISSVSRDLSLQVFYTRLSREEQGKTFKVDFDIPKHFIILRFIVWPYCVAELPEFFEVSIHFKIIQLCLEHSFSHNEYSKHQIVHMSK